MSSEARPRRPISSVMQGQVVTIDPQTTLRDAARALRNADVGTLVVMEGPALTGILSERDVVFALAQDADPNEVWVGDIMSDDPRYLTLGDEVVRAVEVMLAAGIRHLPVVDDRDLVGIVSMRDLVGARRIPTAHQRPGPVRRRRRLGL